METSAWRFIHQSEEEEEEAERERGASKAQPHLGMEQQPT
jgi:hypothetical protein